MKNKVWYHALIRLLTTQALVDGFSAFVGPVEGLHVPSAVATGTAAQKHRMSTSSDSFDGATGSITVRDSGPCAECFCRLGWRNRQYRMYISVQAVVLDQCSDKAYPSILSGLLGINNFRLDDQKNMISSLWLSLTAFKWWRLNFMLKCFLKICYTTLICLS